LIEKLPYNINESYKIKVEDLGVVKLNSHQYKTLRLIVMFASLREMAEYERTSIRTIKGRINTLFKRFKVRHRHALLRLAYLGLIKFQVEGSDEVRSIIIREVEGICPKGQSDSK
jgi:DNA-binding CsgD family transcriptional regulator